MTEKADRHFMQMALGLARRGLGRCWPNPSVGCVIVSPEGHVVGRGHTGEGGRPHGETQALNQAGDAAIGATAYVSLEPCAHHGQTPPCADRLVAARLSRVVIATGDPDTRVAGQGIKILEEAGLQVDFGICQVEANRLNQGFFNRIMKQKPLVTLKVATSLDGRIATKEGESKWITGPEARARGHLLRGQNDAIMVGIGTVLSDDPGLDCRLPGLGQRSPVRIIVDSGLRLPPECHLVETAAVIPTWVITTRPADAKSAILEKRGVRVIGCKADQGGRVDVMQMMQKLSTVGITRLLVEGGAQLNASLIRASLVDRLYWFRSCGIIGGDGLPALPSIGLKMLTEMPEFTLVREGRVGKDTWQEFEIGH
ncbi:bifunctional diaminohydroxyphosphoribosylaminopyrimidine deaminase/5-amino-6-(5-phosphoribosylamino)uracil reductase RibD [Paremcibacter congregatus]|nr:bifunctional diaminohydroxyphosphoribosylaminopyrimidine deaminase/5-amino-6-(5-phosphoribosylamino)uracil reductase RibD [Paremcibacter congregatus]